MNESKLILFDIDGTVVTRVSSRASRKQRAFTQAVESIYAVPNVNFMHYNIFGLTDRGILDLVLRENGLSKAAVELREQAFIAELCRIYGTNLASAPTEYKALPGVVTLLDAISAHKPGLATGNFRMIAYHKLANAGLGRYFSFGGFGEDAADRGEIVAAAMGRSLSDGTVAGYLFGDTPHDIKAGQRNGLRVGAVATGKFTREELQSHCRTGDCVFDDLSDTGAVLEFLSD